MPVWPQWRRHAAPPSARRARANGGMPCAPWIRPPAPALLNPEAARRRVPLGRTRRWKKPAGVNMRARVRLHAALLRAALARDRAADQHDQAARHTSAAAAEHQRKADIHRADANLDRRRAAEI